MLVQAGDVPEPSLNAGLSGLTVCRLWYGASVSTKMLQFRRALILMRSQRLYRCSRPFWRGKTLKQGILLRCWGGRIFQENHLQAVCQTLALFSCRCLDMQMHTYSCVVLCVRAPLTQDQSRIKASCNGSDRLNNILKYPWGGSETTARPGSCTWHSALFLMSCMRFLSTSLQLKL